MSPTGEGHINKACIHTDTHTHICTLTYTHSSTLTLMCTYTLSHAHTHTLVHILMYTPHTLEASGFVYQPEPLRLTVL